MRKPTVAVFLFCLVAIHISCGPDLGWKSPNHGTYFRIEPDPITMAEGRREIRVEVKTDAKINSVYNVGWLVFPYDLANVHSDVDLHGLEATVSVWGSSLGSGYLRAEHAVFAEGRDSVVLTVLSVAAKSLEISPDSVSVAVGESAYLYGMIRDSAGVELYRPNDHTWQSSDTSIVDIDFHYGTDAAAVWAVGRQPGQAVITTSWGSLTATGVVIVH